MVDLTFSPTGFLWGFFVTLIIWLTLLTIFKRR